MIDGNKICFLTFSDRRFNSWKRLRNEAIALGWFDNVIAGDERIFDDWYRIKYKDRFIDRGYGYWQWKSYLIRRELDKMNESEVLLYCDGGCSLNGGGYSRLIDYIKLVYSSKSGIVVFDQGLDVRKWTKGDVFAYFGDNEKYANHGQIASGIILIKKCANAVAMVDEWYYISHNHYDLLTDKPSVVSNFPEFKENRHDQSVLDLLSIKYNADRLSFGEVYRLDEDWSKMLDYPIWATRNRNRKLTPKQRLKKILTWA